MIHIKRTLELLCAYYATKGEPYPLNDVQIAVYAEGLSPYPAEALAAAAKAHMAQSPWFPRLADLVARLSPQGPSSEARALLAWAEVERAIREAGAYRTVIFANGAIGRAVQLVFGGWRGACQFDMDSPGWAIRRQSFLGIFPVCETDHPGGPVMLAGINDRDADPVWIGGPATVPALPSPAERRRDGDAAVIQDISTRWRKERG